MNNLRKFTTEAEYSAATLNYPSVAWITSTDAFHFDKAVPTPATFSGLTVYYNISDISQPTTLFYAGGGSGSGSGSGSGGVLPSSMIIDGTEVEVTSAYAFDTVGEHIVNYSFADNQIPAHFLDDKNTGIFSTVAKVEIGDAITSIDTNTFYGCAGLTSCTIGSGVTSIGDEAFSQCTSLSAVTIPNGVTSIGGSAFAGCSSLTSIEIPNSVTTIGSSAFYSCSSLTSVIIPNSVTSIDTNTFYGCSGLTSIIIGSGVTSIGGSVFGGCESLTSIDIPDSVTSIGGSAFAGCTSLTSIDIPSGVTSIGNQVFFNCGSLTSIVSNATTAPGISSYTFQNIKTGGTLYVPSGSSGYGVWMQNANFYLGLYGWTKVEQ